MTLSRNPNNSRTIRQNINRIRDEWKYPLSAFCTKRQYKLPNFTHGYYHRRQLEVKGDNCPTKKIWKGNAPLDIWNKLNFFLKKLIIYYKIKFFAWLILFLKKNIKASSDILCFIWNIMHFHHSKRQIILSKKKYFLDIKQYIYFTVCLPKKNCPNNAYCYYDENKKHVHTETSYNASYNLFVMFRSKQVDVDVQFYIIALHVPCCTALLTKRVLKRIWLDVYCIL